MGVSVDNGQIVVSHGQFLAKFQRAFGGKQSSSSALKCENRGAIRPRKGRRLQKRRGCPNSSDGQTRAGCWGITIAQSVTGKMRKIFGGHVYEKAAGETETAPFLDSD